MANQDRPTVTTRGQRVFNSNNNNKSTFEWSFQGDMMKIILTPELPESEQTEKRRYDYDHSTITCITRAKCLSLYEECKKELLPLLEKGEPGFRSVPVADVNQFGIGIKPTDKGWTGYVKLIKNINPETLTSNEEISYEFRKGELIKNYDNKTGKFAERVETDDEFLLFLKDLNEFTKAASKAYVHAQRVVDKTYKDMISNDIRSIGKKVGAEMTTFGSSTGGGSQYGQQSLFDNNAPSAPVEPIGSLEELDLPFN